MLRSRQLDEFLNHISHSCCFTFYKSRTMLIKPWVFEEVFFFLLLFKKLFWPSVSHRRTGMGGFLPSAPGHQSKYSSPTYNFVLAKLFSVLWLDFAFSSLSSWFFWLKLFTPIFIYKSINYHIFIETFAYHLLSHNDEFLKGFAYTTVIGFFTQPTYSNRRQESAVFLCSQEENNKILNKTSSVYHRFLIFITFNLKFSKISL